MGRRSIAFLPALALLAAGWLVLGGDPGTGDVGADGSADEAAGAQAAGLVGSGASRPRLAGLAGGSGAGSAGAGIAAGPDGTGGDAAGTLDGGPAGRPVVVRGRVFDGRGRAAAEAEVLVATANGVETLLAGEDGRFEGRLVAGAWPALLKGKDGGVLWLPRLAASAEGEADPEYVLGETGRAIASVVGEDGPLEGLAVSAAFAAPGADAFAAWLAPPPATTRYDGTATFEALLQGPWTFSVRAAESFDLVAKARVAEETRVEFRVPEPLRVEGRVVVEGGGDGAPVAGAEVRLVVDVAGPAKAVATATTDGQGRAVLDLLRGRLEELAVRAEGYAAWPASRNEAEKVLRTLSRPRRASDQERAADGGPRLRGTFRVALRRGSTVYGKVLDEDKAGVAGVVVEAHPADRTVGEPVVPRATTTDDGSYVLEGLAGGRHDLVVASLHVRPVAGPRLRVTLPERPGAPVEVDLVVLRARSLGGVVLDGQGTAVPGARVWVLGGGAAVAGMRRSDLPLEAWTAGDGRWRLDGLPADEPMRLRAARGLDEATPLEVPPGTTRHDLRLVLAATTVLLGRAEDLRTGEPIARARVQVRPHGAAEGRTGHGATTDDDGRWRIEGVLPGAWQVHVHHHQYLQSHPFETSVARGREQDLGVQQLDPGLVLAGTVLDGNGRPLRQAQVVATQEVEEGAKRATRHQTSSDAGGRFVLRGLDPGTTWRLAGSLSKHRPATLRGLDRPSDRLVLVLERIEQPAGR